MRDESKLPTSNDGGEEITPLPQVFYTNETDGMDDLVTDIFDADEEEVVEALNGDEDFPITTEPIEVPYLKMFKRLKGLSDGIKAGDNSKVRLSAKAVAQFNAILKHLNYIEKRQYTIDSYFKFTIFTDFGREKRTKGDNKA